MTPAELKTIRENLGLSVLWIAEHFNVSKRSAQYWESGERTVPDDVSDTLNNLMALLDNAVKESVSLVLEKDIKTVILYRYKTNEELWNARPDLKSYGLPNTYHSAILYSVKKELDRKGVIVNIEYH